MTFRLSIRISFFNLTVYCFSICFNVSICFGIGISILNQIAVFIIVDISFCILNVINIGSNYYFSIFINKITIFFIIIIICHRFIYILGSIKHILNHSTRVSSSLCIIRSSITQNITIIKGVAYITNLFIVVALDRINIRSIRTRYKTYVINISIR